MLKEFMTFDRYLTPSIIRIFYALQIVLVALFGLSGLFAAFAMMSYSMLVGFIYLLACLAATAAGVVAARILTEIVMVLFQNNEHLAVIRARSEGGAPPV